MITVKIGGKSVDTFDNMKISMHLENPMFSEFFINEGYSYSFSLPKSPKTLQQLKNYESRFDVYFKGILFIAGYIFNYSDNTDSFDINVITDAKYLRKKLEELLLNDLDLASYEICDADDPFPVKVAKWSNHMQETLAIDKRKQTHVFPTINSFGYNNFGPIEDPETVNSMMASYQNRINRTLGGIYSLNFQVPIGPIKEWVTTVAPCPKASYLFGKIMEKFGLKVHINELENIQEFIDLFIFNNYVLDKYEDDGTYSWNTTGTEIHLINHVPNCSMFEFFRFLNETFDAYFYIRGNEISVFLAKNMLEQKPRNMSKFAAEVVNNEKQPSDGVNFTYDIPDELLQYYTLFDVDQDPGVFIRNNYYETVSYPYSRITNSETTISSIPMPTTIFSFQTGQPTSYAEHVAIQSTATQWIYTAFGQITSQAFSPAYIKSDEYENDAEIFDHIVFGCHRGVWPSVQQAYLPDGTYNPAGNTTYDHPFTYSFKKGGFVNQAAAPEINVKHIFGTSSVHYDGNDNAFQFFKLPKQNLLYGSTTKSKLLTLPIYELLNLMKFQSVKHVFQKKKESFQGILKSLKFDIEHKGISQVEAKYVVKNKGLQGEFSRDFNEDFFI